MKINIDIPQENNKTRIKSKINLIEKKDAFNKNDDGTITIKVIDNKGKGINANFSRNHKFNNNIFVMIVLIIIFPFVKFVKGF